MNYSKLVKIIPMLDSPIDAEALAALRAVQRALAPETFGDVARLIEAAIPNEVEPEPEAKPFTGFKAAAKPSKAPKPQGDGWVWLKQSWGWYQVPKPSVSRFETLVWAGSYWEIKIDFPAVLTAAMQVMSMKLDRRGKARANAIAMRAMEDKNINSIDLSWLEQMERAFVNV